MTPQAVLTELLDRIAASHGAPVLISADELADWPAEAVTALQSQGVITRARPAASTVCPGCERECAMPVHTLPGAGRAPGAFIVCDKRSDINRVAVPLDRLEQWQASGDSVADLLAELLGLQRPGRDSASSDRWEIGLLKGARHSSHVVMRAENGLTLELAGHTVALADVLALADGAFNVDGRALTRLVDQPVAGAGDVESATQRRDRLRKRVQTLKAKGIRAFLKTVAEEEGISVSRLKQLLKDETEPAKPNPGW